jgi:hypothetical protein
MHCVYFHFAYFVCTVMLHSDVLRVISWKCDWHLHIVDLLSYLICAATPAGLPPDLARSSDSSHINM